MNRGEIKTQILVRSGKTTTSSWISDAFINDWINQAHTWAAGFKPWPYTEGRTETTYAGVEELNFEGYKADSFGFMKVGDKLLRKLNFKDYQLFKENTPEADDKVYSDFGGLVYINPNMGISGTLVAYGQYAPAEMDVDTAETVFTAHGDEGNEAIIEICLANAKSRDGQPQEIANHQQLARLKLEELWKRIEDEQYNYHTKDRGMWDRMDIIDGNMHDDGFKRDQF